MQEHLSYYTSKITCYILTQNNVFSGFFEKLTGSQAIGLGHRLLFAGRCWLVAAPEIRMVVFCRVFNENPRLKFWADVFADPGEFKFLFADSHG